MRKLHFLTMAAVTAAAIGGGMVATAALKAPSAHADAVGALHKVDNFRLTSADRQSYELYHMKDDRAVVLVTHASSCLPLQKAAPALKQVAATKGVDLLMLDSNPKDGEDKTFADATNMGVTAPVLMDADQLVGEQLGVTSAGEAIVINPKNWSIAWRGPVADAQGAVDAVVAGQAPPAASAVSACPISFPDRSKKAQFENISYAKDIAPIIQDRCVSCHEPGGLGPMPFTSYEKVKGFAPMIREVIRTQRMPPWHPDPNIGHFKDDEGLSAAQTRTLVHWIEAGAPRGAGDDPLTKVKFESPEWPYGKPDLVLDVPAFEIPANGTIEYQSPFVVNPEKEGHWLRASAFKVDQHQAVHHILTGYMSEVPKVNSGPSEGKWGTTVGTYVVGTTPLLMPKDAGAYVPAGGAIGFQNHYTAFGKDVVDHTQLGLYFYKEKPKLMMRTMVISDQSIEIQPNTERSKETAYMPFPHDAILYSGMFHSHYRGSGTELKAIYPDGTTQILISCPKFDFNWQRDYVFDQPIKIPAGTKLVATYIYDNSKRAVVNPDPNRVVPWGAQSWDEMLYVQMRYRWADETTANESVGKAHDKDMFEWRVMGSMDDNHDGVLQKAELKGAIGRGILANFDKMDTNHDGVLQLSEIKSLSNRFNRNGEENTEATKTAAADTATKSR
jgi:hypothetical protein